MFNIFKSAPKNYENLDGKTFKAKFQTAPKAELLDVRTAGEFASGTIKGAKNLDVTTGQFQNALGSLDKDKEYFVFCRSGNRSGSACDLMSAQGFKCYNLAGGIGAWPNN
ncbi:rhodanese-like domain-containing protein [Pontibacter ramchanderi]|uniref:Rhodanese-related sulfurtransferase n=1 Tax=Pontibacter ramchanderi TaxID=1179743 RepID=A0A2N3V0I5_9BACT|nr:rhodanese-like domain-containing protein [Pontibacter ramchanderi]PKV75160.1 rhodanese-related sulfurtransferase [Pontibacter ramchanderi]